MAKGKFQKSIDTVRLNLQLSVKKKYTTKFFAEKSARDNTKEQFFNERFAQ